LLSNEKIERKWIEVKEKEKTCGNLKIASKNFKVRLLFKSQKFSPSIFQEFNFDSKLNFPYFLAPSLRNKRESVQILVVKKKKSQLTLISAMKKIDFDVNRFIK